MCCRDLLCLSLPAYSICYCIFFAIIQSVWLLSLVLVSGRVLFVITQIDLILIEIEIFGYICYNKVRVKLSVIRTVIWC